MLQRGSNRNKPNQPNPSWNESFKVALPKQDFVIQRDKYRPHVTDLTIPIAYVRYMANREARNSRKPYNSQRRDRFWSRKIRAFNTSSTLTKWSAPQLSHISPPSSTHSAVVLVVATRATYRSEGGLPRGGTMKSVTPTTYGPPFDGFSIALSLLTVCIPKNVNLQTDECTIYISRVVRNWTCACFCCFLRLLFDPEGGDDMILRNVAHSPNYTAL
jgi:hypothetical protein